MGPSEHNHASSCTSSGLKLKTNGPSTIPLAIDTCPWASTWMTASLVSQRCKIRFWVSLLACPCGAQSPPETPAGWYGLVAWAYWAETLLFTLYCRALPGSVMCFLWSEASDSHEWRPSAIEYEVSTACRDKHHKWSLVLYSVRATCWLETASRSVGLRKLLDCSQHLLQMLGKAEQSSMFLFRLHWQCGMVRDRA